MRVRYACVLEKAFWIGQTMICLYEVLFRERALTNEIDCHVLRISEEYSSFEIPIGSHAYCLRCKLIVWQSLMTNLHVIRNRL